MPRTILHAKAPAEPIAPGVWRDRMQPGGRRGPADQVLAATPGGQVWNDSFVLGGADVTFQLMVPDIRLPANQYWPLHWHDCWIAVVILDGSCLIGDWWMAPGDVLISASGIEYGPLVIGPDGCRMFEVFARLHEQQGGYAPEYRDHPTLAGGNHVFRPRSALNARNEGRSCLPCDGVKGLIKGRLVDGAHWILGAPDDTESGAIAYSTLPAHARLAPNRRSDWYALFVMRGGGSIGARPLADGDVIIVEPEAALPEIVAGPDGIELFEAARTLRAMEPRI